MGKRREGREAAVQFLFFRDLNPEAGPDSLDRFWKLCATSADARKFAAGLIDGVLEHQEGIDERIKAYVVNYDIHRIAAVDRSILRLALYEMLYREDVPPVVAINEAIEIAKRFGAEESGKFVNGILDRAKLDIARPLRSARRPAGKSAD